MPRPSARCAGHRHQHDGALQLCAGSRVRRRRRDAHLAVCRPRLGLVRLGCVVVWRCVVVWTCELAGVCLARPCTLRHAHAHLHGCILWILILWRESPRRGQVPGSVRGTNALISKQTCPRPWGGSNRPVSGRERPLGFSSEHVASPDAVRGQAPGSIRGTTRHLRLNTFLAMGREE
eukprot:240883-Chlamydomonas_euryale.AAC.1